MIYRCRCCNYEEERGFLPGVSCGMLLLAQMGFSAVLLISTVRYLRSLVLTTPDSPIPSPSPGMGWWALVIIPLMMIVGFVVLFVAAMILNALMEFMEWCAFSLRRCPECSRRRWSWGFTRGFGL